MNRIVAKSITKTLDLAANPEAVFDFLANPLNWPQFAVINLKSIKPGKENCFQIISKNGPGELKMCSCKEYGILDHVWKDSQASWHVYMRAIPNYEGTTLLTTFFQPKQIDSTAFEKSMQEMDLEFAKLRTILEKSFSSKMS